MAKNDESPFNTQLDEREVFTVVVCCKNSSRTIQKCIEAIQDAIGHKRLIVIDGGSNDETRQILESLDVSVRDGYGMGLSRDRQLGIDLATTKFTFFIDSDHLVGREFFLDMFEAFRTNRVDFLQSRLRLFEPKGILALGEDSYYQEFHNKHWNKKMIGIAPSLFITENLKSGKHWQLYSEKSRVIDDTSWAKRASDRGAIFMVGGPEVYQVHSAHIADYLRKFFWYGKGDADFILEFPERKTSMYFHLLIRYPWIFGTRLLLKGKIFGFVFVQTQGFIRFISALVRFFSQKF